MNSHLKKNTCTCGYIGICEKSAQFKQLHAQIHKQFEASKENNENEENEYDEFVEEADMEDVEN